MNGKIIDFLGASTRARDGANCETHENYTKVIVQKGRYRIIACKAGIQWILQRRRDLNMVTARYEAISYPREVV